MEFSGIITPKKKPHVKLKAVSLKLFLVFLNLPKVHSLSTFSLLSESRDEILSKGIGCDTLGVLDGNVSGANQYLHANYENFNQSY